VVKKKKKRNLHDLKIIFFFFFFFYIHHRVKTGSGAHPASCPIGIRGSFPGGKTDQSPPSSAVVNAWSFTTHTSL